MAKGGRASQKEGLTYAKALRQKGAEHDQRMEGDLRDYSREHKGQSGGHCAWRRKIRPERPLQGVCRLVSFLN